MTLESTREAALREALEYWLPKEPPFYGAVGSQDKIVAGHMKRWHADKTLLSAPAVEAGEGKPVAWRYRERMRGGQGQPCPNWHDWRLVSCQPQGPADENFLIEPLYAYPSPSAIRLAQEDLNG